MKKIITISISVLILVATIFALSAWSPQPIAEEEKNPINGLPLVENKVEKKTMELGLTAASKTTVTYKFSEKQESGRIFDVYEDESGNEFTLADDGSIRMVMYYSASPSRKTETQVAKANLINKEKGRQIVLGIINEIADNPTVYEETLFNSNGIGADKLYSYTYHETVSGIKTMNKIRITLNAYGEVLTYLHINDFDFSEIATRALSSVTNDKLNSFVESKLSKKHLSYVIDDMHIFEDNGEYAIRLLVTAYTSTNESTYDSYEFYYPIN